MSTQDDLNSAMDALNDEIDNCERYLSSLGYGERVSVPFKDKAMLVFGKQESDWILFVAQGDNVVPLLSSSKKRRIEAVALLPKLLEAMQEATAERVKQVREAIEFCKKFRS